MTDIVERLESVEFMGMPDGVLDYSTASEAADRIESLEARIAKADALAEAHLAIVETTEGLTGTIIQECRQISRKALAAYREGSDPNCSEPGCHAEAQAAIAALEPVTVREAAQILYNMPEEDRMRVWRATRDCPTGAEFGKWFCKGLRALIEKDATDG